MSKIFTLALPTLEVREVAQEHLGALRDVMRSDPALFPQFTEQQCCLAKVHAGVLSAEVVRGQEPDVLVRPGDFEVYSSNGKRFYTSDYDVLDGFFYEVPWQLMVPYRGTSI